MINIKNFLYKYRIFLYIVFFIVCIGIYFRNLLNELPALETLKEYKPILSTKLYDRNNQLITEYFTERRTWIPVYEIPASFRNAVLAIEDQNFFKHWGISFKGIVRASINNLLHRRVAAGGSTITQQLTKVAFLSQERTIRRKIKELILALQIERNFSKQEIFEMYANQVYFGHGVYGVEQAAAFYFSKSTRDLTLGESALLTGLIRSPQRYSPVNYPERAIKRRELVLKNMKKLKMISENEMLAAMRESFFIKKGIVGRTKAPYFAEYIKIMIEEDYGPEVIYSAGWKVYTTLDLQMQTTAEIVVDTFLAEFDKRQYELTKTTHSPIQCALLAMDPATGHVLAMIGGRNFSESQFNRAIQMRRQPGSAFKPIVYTAALEKGYTPTTIIDDTSLVYVNDGRDWRLQATATSYLEQLPKEWVEDPLKVWVPQNYKEEYHGKVFLRRALELSLNSCAIRTIAEIGPTTVIGYARKFGIESPLTNTLSLSLGSSDLTLIEMVRAFGVLANRGIRTKPFSILRIEDGSGRIIKQNLSEEEDVLSEQTCYVMTNMLKGVIEEGTGVYAKDVIRRPAAGKTGTTNDFTDAWFIGYTPQIVCGVWVGYDDKMTLGKKNSGGVIACPIWAHFIRRAFKGKEQVDFPVPLTGVTSVNIDGNTGYLATPNSKNEYNEAFLSGTEPKVSLICPTTDQIVNKVEEGEDEVIQTALEKPDTTEEKPQENSSENLQESTGTIHQ